MTKDFMDLQNDTIERMKKKADSLVNGSKGDTNTLCEVVSDMAHVLAAVARYGCFRGQEIHRPYKFNWPMAVTTITIIIAIIGMILKFTNG